MVAVVVVVVVAGVVLGGGGGAGGATGEPVYGGVLAGRTALAALLYSV